MTLLMFLAAILEEDRPCRAPIMSSVGAPHTHHRLQSVQLYLYIEEVMLLRDRNTRHTRELQQLSIS